MATMNVNAGVTDDFYRYKMPELQVKIEGKRNGIKTLLANVSEIAKCLHRPPQYITKYFGCELGAQTQMSQVSNRFVVNGAHERAKLQHLLTGFIKKFVLCSVCGNPETHLVVTKKHAIDRVCIACGQRGVIDMSHKLTVFILKNPPTAEHQPTTNRLKAMPAVAVKDCDNGHIQDDESAIGDGTLMAPSATEELGDTGWSVDVSADAVRKRQADLSTAVAAVAVTADSELPEEDRLLQLFDVVAAQHRTNSVATSASSVYKQAQRLDVVDKAVLIICEVVLDEKVLAQLEAYQSMLLQYTDGNVKAQLYLLGAVEKLVGRAGQAVMDHVVHILKACYDLDLVDEEVFIKWHRKASRRFVDKQTALAIRDKAAPFVTWLKEAETESSSEEEDGLFVKTTDSNPPAALGGSAAADEEGSDLDIDNI